MGYEQAFPKTEPGEVDIKTLPAGRLLESRSNTSYFDNNNGLFGPLFRYIQKHDIAMTTPVEARMNPGVMYFWVSSDQVEKAKQSTSDVNVLDVPERTVVALGARGSYNQNNYQKAEHKLREWLAANPQIKPKGEPFGVFWNGPFTPWFMKLFEVQIEVESAGIDSMAQADN